jgi:transcription elongation GreA/GreB family factor
VSKAFVNEDASVPEPELVRPATRQLTPEELEEIRASSAGGATLGDAVVVRENGKSAEHRLVAPGQDGTSVRSPLGRALLGKRAGDTVEVETPRGVRVLSVERVG